MRSGLRRFGLIVSLGGIILVAAGCFPVSHPTFTSRSAPGSGVDFKLLSGDGNFVVVQTPTGVSRVDRRDNTTVPLPAGFPEAISRDGTLVWLGSVLWSAARTLTPPPGTRMSRDLTFGVFVDTDGMVKTWETATQTIRPVEPGFPRPVLTTGAVADAVSNDGRTVQYTLNTQLGLPVTRFVSLDSHQKFDLSVDPSLNSLFLAPSGTAFLHTFNTGPYGGDPFNPISWAELVALPSGSVLRHYDSTGSGIMLGTAFFADSSNLVWVYAAVTVPNCFPILPTPSPCTSASQFIAISALGMRVIDTGPGEFTPGSGFVSSSGLYVLFTKDTLSLFPTGLTYVPGPVGVVNLFNNYVEFLGCTPDGVCSPVSRFGQISDDGKVVATTATGGGWWEFTPAP